jgi:hypothetical protein
LYFHRRSKNKCRQLVSELVSVYETCVDFSF